MSKYKSLGTGLGGEIKLNDGVVVINDVPYGRFGDDGKHIMPYKYGNPTLIVDEFGCVSGAFDGITYGKLCFTGNNVTGIILTDEGERLLNGNNDTRKTELKSMSETAEYINAIERAYNKATNSRRTTGYANSFGTPVKIIAIILIVLIIATVFIMDPPK